METGILYIVATPIGNMEDITLRAIRILGEVDLIAAEDTRHTVKLLNHLDIKTKMISFHEHSDQRKEDEILYHLSKGENIALVSDAGTPLISDPGAGLVKSAIQNGHRVIPIPGACAVITALSVCGIYDHGFCFIGFLPTRSKDKTAVLDEIKANRKTCVIYESPHRLLKTLEALQDILDQDRQIVVAREMTKVYEEFVRGNAQHAIDYFSQKTVKGEIAIIISAAQPIKVVVTDTEIVETLESFIENGCTKKDAVLKTASQLSLSKNKVYKLSLNL
jgi:16S rRNA (cytidine1402-2'-O)-methyltransferase